MGCIFVVFFGLVLFEKSESLRALQKCPYICEPGHICRLKCKILYNYYARKTYTKMTMIACYQCRHECKRCCRLGWFQREKNTWKVQKKSRKSRKLFEFNKAYGRTLNISNAETKYCEHKLSRNSKSRKSKVETQKSKVVIVSAPVPI